MKSTVLFLVLAVLSSSAFAQSAPDLSNPSLPRPPQTPGPSLPNGNNDSPSVWCTIAPTIACRGTRGQRSGAKPPQGLRR